MRHSEPTGPVPKRTGVSGRRGCEARQGCLVQSPSRTTAGHWPYHRAAEADKLPAMIITIDGPAGSGKSMVARRLAQELGIAHLDTGATYRAVTLKALEEGTDLEDSAALARLARQAHVELVMDPAGARVLLDGRDVSAGIRSEHVTRQSYYLARSAQVREVLVALQRRLGEQLGSFIAEGRDQGSVVFPHAQVKFYLDAAPPIRAQRRYRELLDRGQGADYQQVLADLMQRDDRDRSRRVGPLRPAKDAIVVDTSDLTVEQVVAELKRHVEQGG